MKFSDMMGQGDEGGTDVEEDAAPQPPAARTAPPLPEAPVQFGGNRSEPADGEPVDTEPGAAASITAPVVAERPDAALAAMPSTGPVGDPLLSEVVAELAPRGSSPVRATGASDQQLDATSWLEGLNTIDDDLLPR